MTVAVHWTVNADDIEVPSRGIVLVAEDADETRLMLALCFAQEGYEVGCATNASEMIALLESTPTPAAIFVDLLMPEGFGHVILDYLASEPRFALVPTAILTGFPEYAPAGYRVFEKPASFEALVEFIQEGKTGHFLAAEPDAERARRRT